METAESGLALWINRLTRRSRLSADECDAIMALPGKLEWIKGGRDFVRLGENVTHACLVVSGMAGRFGQARSGDRLTTAIHIAGDMADLHSVVLPKAASALHSLGDAQIYRVPHPAVIDLTDRYPALAQAFWRDCTVDAAVLSQWALTNARQDAISRIAHLLAELGVRFSVAFPDQGRDFDFPLTQAQVGDATGLTAIHVNRMLRALREAGLAEVRDKRVHILDWDRLCHLGEFDPTYLHLHQER